jgi:hypothetical protein
MGSVSGGITAMPRYLFVTGKLAAPSLRDCLKGIADLDFELMVLPISVAALMDAKFVAKHLMNRMDCDKVLVPGLCGGDLQVIEDTIGAEVIRGPKSLKDIPRFLEPRKHWMDTANITQKLLLKS